MKKIHLSKETLRVLSADEARAVAGGSVRDDCNPTETRPATGCGGTTTGTTGTTTGPVPTSPAATCPSPSTPAATCPPTPTTPAAGCPGGTTTGTLETVRRCPP